MKKIMQKGLALSVSKGFTLVELLIVIALLGALAIGLIGALDPFEQLKKGTDTGTRNSVSEIHSAIIRYYALKGYMPWCSDALSCPGTTHPSSTALSVAPMSGALAEIVTTGELKSNFTTINEAELGKVFITADATDITACYQPTSKSFLSDANTKYMQNGIEDTVTCNTTDHKCYWCVK